MSKTKILQKHKRQTTANNFKLRRTTKIKDLQSISKGNLHERKTVIYYMDNLITQLRTHYTGEVAVVTHFDGVTKKSVFHPLQKFIFKALNAKNNKNTKFSKRRRRSSY